MELIKEINGKIDKNGKYRKWGIFHCPECGQNIERSFSAKKQKTCGCKIGKVTYCENRRLYHIWNDMKRRCTNKKTRHYIDYGGRGINVCREWYDSFIVFRNWSFKNGYSDGLQIDRVDNDGDYCPENCRFVTSKLQSRNKRSNVINIQKAMLIRSLYGFGKLTQKRIAELFDVDVHVVWYVVNNKTWNP